MDERFEPCVRCGFRRPVRVMKIGPSETPDPLAPVSGTRGFSCKRMDHCDLLLGLRAGEGRCRKLGTTTIGNPACAEDAGHTGACSPIAPAGATR